LRLVQGKLRDCPEMIERRREKKSGGSEDGSRT
jgi:hypothetical protein